jgi:RNA polymerase sigma-70 factor, ECF subfamily
MNSLVTCTTTFEQLYRDYHEPILRYLERLVGHRETAEDLCQETFLKVFQHGEEYTALLHQRAWLYRIATNTAYDHFRWQRRRRLSPLSEDMYALDYEIDLAERLDDAETIRQVLLRLPTHNRLALLYASAGYDLKTIATELGCKAATVKTRIHRARVHFQALYAA